MKTHKDYSTQAPPMAHQLDDIAWATRVKRGLLANEPGLGKSRSAIEATRGARTLIIAPSMVITGGTWSDELEKWAEDPGLYTVAPYSLLNARKGNKPLRVLRPEYKQPWDAVIVDEAHYTKGRGTSWTWAVDQVTRPAEAVLEMTGTPMANWAQDLFPLLRVLHGPAESRPGGAYGSYWRWAEQWFDCSPTRFSNGNPVCGELLACDRSCLERPVYDACEHYADFMQANLGDQYRRVLRDACLDLPPLTQAVVDTPMTTAQRRIYRELKNQFATTVSGRETLAWSQGALNVMIDKVTTSPWLLNKEGVPRGGKLDRLAFDLSGRSRPTLVLAHYNDSVEACALIASMGGASVRAVYGKTTQAQDRESIRDFKAGRVDVLCASLEKVAEGVQLTAADMVIFVEKSFKPYRNEQALYRIHRLGQTRPCTSLDYTTPQTVDARKRRLLATKTDRQMRYLTAAEYQRLL